MLSPIAKLDAALQFLVNSYPLYKMFNEYDAIRNMLQKMPEFKDVTENEFAAILRKLSKDGYVDMEYIENSKGLFQRAYWRYCLTFEGAYFIQNGGYAQKAIDASKIEDQKDFRERLLSWGQYGLRLVLFVW